MPELMILSLRVPRESENTPEASAQLLASLGKATKNPDWLTKLFGQSSIFISLELTVISGQVTFNIVFPRHLRTFVESQVLATYPNAIITEIKDYLKDIYTEGVTHALLIKQQYASYFPLRDYADYKEVDPMLPVLGVLSKALEEDKVLVQFVMAPPNKNIFTNARSYLHPKPQLDAEGHTVKNVQPEGKKLVEDKLSQPLLSVSIRFLANRPELLHDLTGAISVLDRPDGNSLVKSFVYPWDRKRLLQKIFERKPLDFWLSGSLDSCTLNVMELSSLWHLPGIYTKIPNVAWAPSAALQEAPENLPVHHPSPEMRRGDGSEVEKSDDINFFAQTVYKNKNTIFGLKLADRLRHTYILGKSGTGKSTLLENMAVDDIKKDRGVAFIDPHGDSAEALLNYIPSKRINDVIYFNPADRDYPITLNILEVDNPDQAELVASSIVAIFHKLYANSWGPRLEYILRNTVLTLTQIPSSTMPDIVKMLTDQKFRKEIYTKLTDQSMLNFWQKEYDILDEKVRAEQISSILNKVGQFVNSPLIRNIINTPKSTLKLDDVLNSSKILIANLSQGRLGEDNAALLGAMFITKLQLAAMSRVDMPKEKRKEFFLYVDEFQNFATGSFIKILSEARKYGLGLILANQYIYQIPEEIQKAIFGNVGTSICFVVGADDARVMEFEFGGKFTQTNLVSLQKHQIAMKMTIDNQITEPFSAMTLPPLKSTNQNKSKVITQSRSRYSSKK